MKSAELKKKYKGYLQTLIGEIKSRKSSEVILNYLDFCSKFHRYSFHNRILIWMDMSEATRVAGFHAWKKLGRSVKKGEKGIPIFAPVRVKKKPEPADNEGITEEDEKTYNKERMFFKVVYVWDVSQTEGDPLPETPDAMGVSGSAETILPLLERHTLSEGISHTLAHELAHEYLHKGVERKEYSKKLKETEAEAAAYIVSRHFGLKLKSSTYLAIYQTEEIDIQGSFDRITNTASRILRGIESVPADIKKAA